LRVVKNKGDEGKRSNRASLPLLCLHSSSVNSFSSSCLPEVDEDIVQPGD